MSPLAVMREGCHDEAMAMITNPVRSCVPVLLADLGLAGAGTGGIAGRPGLAATALGARTRNRRRFQPSAVTVAGRSGKYGKQPVPSSQVELSGGSRATATIRQTCESCARHCGGRIAVTMFDEIAGSRTSRAWGLSVRRSRRSRRRIFALW